MNFEWTGKGDRYRPKRMTACYAGQMRQMEEEDDSWGPAEWANYIVTSSTRFHPACKTFTLLVEYQTRTLDRWPLFEQTENTVSLRWSQVQFVVKGIELGAHLGVVASASPVLAAMLVPGTLKDGRCKPVHIEDMEPEAFEQLLRYIYTGTAKLFTFAEQLLVAAERYHLNALKENCEVLLSLKLTRKKVLMILALGYKCSAPRLVKSALERVADDKLFQCPEWQELSRAQPEIFKLAAKRLPGVLRERKEWKLPPVMYPMSFIPLKPFKRNSRRTCVKFHNLRTFTAK